MPSSGSRWHGARLQEAALAKEFSLSRPRIRDAFIALEQQGLIERPRNKGAIVVRLDLKRVFEILELRENLEGLCVKLSTQNRPPESWQYLVDLFNGPMVRYVAEGNIQAYLIEVEKFRNDLGQVADNSVLLEMLLVLRDRTRIIIDRTTMLPGRLQQGLRELQQVVAAMRQGDAEEAERLRRINIRSQREFVRKRPAITV